MFTSSFSSFSSSSFSRLPPLCLYLFLTSLLFTPVLATSSIITPNLLKPVPATPVITTTVTTTPIVTTTPAVTTTESRGGVHNKTEHVESKQGRIGEGRRKKDELIEGKKGGMKIVKHFYLWTRKNSGNSSSQVLDPTRPDTMMGSLFQPGKTFVIIHGFLGWGTEAWILHLKDKLLGVLPSNVISVDWPAGSTWWLPSYYTAVSRVPSVAKDLSALLHGLATTRGLELKDVHLIGHSLGAHVAGLAAAAMTHTVGRISGLDPAGLMYHRVLPSQRLDPSDADYVDVIHTNGCYTLNKWLDCYGINENLGHSDFWPNGGKHQPSCGRRGKVANGEIGCSHEMAYVYYIESLDYSVDQTFYLARACDNWDDYKGGQCSCGWETQYMGFSVNSRLNGTYYLATNASPPYATKDDGCPPGSATAPGVRIIKFALISASALIAIGGVSGAIVSVVAKRRSAEGATEEEEEVGAVGSGGGGNSEVAVDVGNKKLLLDNVD